MKIRRSGRIRAAIAVSGRGSNAHALLAAAREKSYPVDFYIVISDRPSLFVDARDNPGHADYPPYLCFRRRDLGQRGMELEMHAALTQFRIELLCLAGFMTILSKDFVRQWRHRILNIHPSLLPAYRGLATHSRVLLAGDTIHGCTVHVVTEELDDGPVLAQARVPVTVSDDETGLAKRVLREEHRLYPKTVASYVCDSHFLSLPLLYQKAS